MANLRTLAKIDLFRALPAKELDRLDSRCTWRDACSKEWIIEHEEEGTDIFFVTAGEVRVLVQSFSGRQVILADIASGSYFGEMSAIDGRPRSASVRALTKATLGRMSASSFWDALHEYAPVREQLLKRLVARARQLTQRVDEFSSLDVRHRIYAELLRLSKPDPSNKAGAILSPPPVHAEFAARVSTQREMVARELKALERGGLLIRRRGALVITDTRKLVQELEEKRDAN